VETDTLEAALRAALATETDAALAGWLRALLADDRAASEVAEVPA
jgi:hypothetical protein